MKFDPDVNRVFAVKCYGCGKCATGRINGNQCPDGVFFCSPTCALRWATALPPDDPLWDAVPLPQVWTGSVTGSVEEIRARELTPEEKEQLAGAMYQFPLPQGIPKINEPWAGPVLRAGGNRSEDGAREYTVTYKVVAEPPADEPHVR